MKYMTAIGLLVLVNFMTTTAHVNEDGSNVWRTSPNRPHAYLVRKMDTKKIAAVIEELMLRQP